MIMKIKGQLYKQEGSFGIYQMMFPFLAASSKMKDYLGKIYGKMWCFIKNNFGQIYLEQEGMEKVVKSFLRIAKKDFPKIWQKKWSELDKRITAKSFFISTTNLDNLSLQRLYNLYREMEMLHQEMWAISIFIDTLDPGTDQTEIDKIAKQYEFSSEEIQVLLSPITPSYVANFDGHLFQYKKKKISFKKIKEQFFWWSTDYIRHNEIDEKFINKLANDAQPSHFHSSVKNQQKILKKYRLLENPFSTFQILSAWRDQRKRLNFTSLYGLERILAVVFKRQDIKTELINGLLPEEAKKIILGAKIDQYKLKNRINDGFFAYFKNNKIQGIKQGKAAVKQGKELEGLCLRDVKADLKGIVACKGYAKGIARVILSAHSKEAEKLKEGDILVTSMTRPEFINLMKKAAAFVTDEGGISCHAAIVAREMKKPCIIGTKIATKVLHDGDLVEVDTNNDIVKILQKAK
jgi:phosphohistidine swiveling domain-containing protein